MKRFLFIMILFSFLAIPMLLFGSFFPSQTVFAVIEEALNIEFGKAVIQEKEALEGGVTFWLLYQIGEIRVMYDVIVFEKWRSYTVIPAFSNTPTSFQFAPSSLEIAKIILDNQFGEVTFSSMGILSDGLWVFEKYWYSEERHIEVKIILKAPLKNKWIIRK